jgi:hypothetical protein
MSRAHKRHSPNLVLLKSASVNMLSVKPSISKKLLSRLQALSPYWLYCSQVQYNHARVFCTVQFNGSATVRNLLDWDRPSFYVKPMEQTTQNRTHREENLKKNVCHLSSVSRKYFRNFVKKISIFFLKFQPLFPSTIY